VELDPYSQAGGVRWSSTHTANVFRDRVDGSVQIGVFFYDTVY